MFASLILPVLIQVGPNPSAPATLGVPEELTELRRRQRAEQMPLETADAGRLERCLARADQDSTAVILETGSTLTLAAGLERAEALHCRGYAQAVLGQWQEAAQSFTSARDAATVPATQYRARLGAIAGNAFLNAGEPLLALDPLDSAQKDAALAGFPALGGEVALDRARALVALGETAKASEALAEARRLVPLSPRAWLLSATLARRMEKLPEATDFIAQAKTLDPTNPEILLEAGLIAVLSGDDAAARAQWEAVLASPVPGPQAAIARDYLDQLGQ